MTAQTATTSPGWTRQREALIRALRAFTPKDQKAAVKSAARGIGHQIVRGVLGSILGGR